MSLAKLASRFAMGLACVCVALGAIAEAAVTRAKVGVLWPANGPDLSPFKNRLRDLGWTEGRNIEYVQLARRDDERAIAAQLNELVDAGVSVLYLQNSEVPTAMRITQSVPIVCPAFSDPVAEGATGSLARPDRNVTGLSWQSIPSAEKRVQLARDALPKMRRLAILREPSDRASVMESSALAAAARRMSLDVEVVDVRGADELPGSFARMQRGRIDAVIVSSGPLLGLQHARVLELANEARIPVVSELPFYAEAGAVLTYGAAAAEVHGRGAYFVDRLLRGARPADLPFEQVTTFELVVNLRAARSLGLAIPEAISARATRVIE